MEDELLWPGAESRRRHADFQSALEQEKRLHPHRKLDWYIDDDDCWVFRGRFTAEQGEIIFKALRSASDEIWKEQESAEDIYH